MSRERDLLARVLTSELWSVQEELQAEIKQLLAQPEQSEQEPVAWYWEDSDLDDPEWIAMADTGDKPIEHRLRRNIQPLYLAPQKNAEAEFEQAIKDTIDTTKLMQILKDGGILIEVGEQK